MAACPEPCVSSSGGDSSGSEAGSICLQFGVRSYLHHFYEECSSSMRDRDPEDRGFVRRQRSARACSSVAWKVSLALGVLLLSAGVASLSVRFSSSRRIESFGEGELLFVDADAVRHNEALRVSAAAGAALTCLGAALALTGACLWLLPQARLRVKSSKLGEAEEEDSGVRGRLAPGPGEGKVPVTLSKVEIVQPAS